MRHKVAPWVMLAAVVVCGFALLWAFMGWPADSIVLPVSIFLEACLAALLVAMLVTEDREAAPAAAELVRCPQCSSTFSPPVGEDVIECPVCHYRADAPRGRGAGVSP